MSKISLVKISQITGDLVTFTDYELGLLYARSGDKTQSKHHLGTVLSGKSLVQKLEKGKYSMEVRLL